MRLKRKTSQRMVGYGFLLPALLLFLLIELFPVLYNVYMSFHKWRGFGKPTFVGFSNYVDLFNNSVFIQSLTHNGIFLLVAFGIMLPFSFFVALILDSGIPGSSVFRWLYFLPVITPMIVIGLVWSRVYSPQGGILNQALELVGMAQLQTDWLGNPDTALGAVLAVWVWRHFGYGVIMFYAGLIGIPDDLKDAASIDGASPLQKVFFVIIPLMKSIIFIVGILFAIWALKVFTLIFVMTYGGPFHATEVVNTFMYNTVFQYYKLGSGSAVTTITLVLLVLFSILRNRLRADVEF